MPIYEYKCNDCSAGFEKITTSSSSEARVECPDCKSANVIKQISAANTIKTTGLPAAGGCGGTGGFS